MKVYDQMLSISKQVLQEGQANQAAHSKRRWPSPSVDPGYTWWLVLSKFIRPRDGTVVADSQHKEDEWEYLWQKVKHGEQETKRGSGYDIYLLHEHTRRYQ